MTFSAISEEVYTHPLSEGWGHHGFHFHPSLELCCPHLHTRINCTVGLSMTAEKISLCARFSVCPYARLCIRSSLCVYVYVYLHTYLCVLLSECVCMSLCVCLQAYLCTWLCLSVSIYAHMPILEPLSLLTYHLLRSSLSSAVFYSFQRFRSMATFVRYSLKCHSVMTLKTLSWNLPTLFPYASCWPTSRTCALFFEIFFHP